MHKKHYLLFAFVVFARLFLMAPAASAQVYYATELSYTGYLSGYSYTYASAYEGEEYCVAEDYDEDDNEYCALYQDWIPWVSLNGWLYDPSGTQYYGSDDIEDSYAEVTYPEVGSPTPGTWQAQGQHYLGWWVYYDSCDEYGDCGGDEFAYSTWNLLGYSSDSATAPALLTWISYSVSSFYAPGCVTVNFDSDVPYADFEYSFNGTVLTAYSFPNGGQSCISATQTQLFGTYQLLAAETSGAYSGWTWPNALGIPVIALLTVFAPPPPVISASGNVIWYFAGQSPAGYPLSVTLTSSQGGATSWQVTSGNANLVNLSSNVGASITVTSSGAAFSRGVGDIQIVASAYGLPSQPVSLTSRTPTTFVRQTGSAVTATQCGGQYTWDTYIYYMMLDNLGSQLPQTLPINEAFGAPVAVYQGMNWVQGPPAGGQTLPGSLFYDHIGGETLNYNPQPICPDSPTGPWVEVENWPQQWFLGSATVGVGKLMQSDTLHKYLGHGDHTIP